MSLSVDGTWKAGVWTTTVWKDGVWLEGAAAATASGGGQIPRRRRYLLPNDELVLATQEEIVELLQQFVVVETPKPQNRKQKRKAKHEPFIPVEIHFEPLPDFQVRTFKAVLPQRAIWKPDLKAMAEKAAQLRRRIDDEEAILLLL